MSFRIRRNGRVYEVECFSNREVVRYLDKTLNTNDLRFRQVSQLKLGDGVMAKFDDVYFMIYTDTTSIEIAFDGHYRDEMNEVIRTLIRWDRFSKTETTFYVEIEEGKDTPNYSYTFVFENGYAGKYAWNWQNMAWIRGSVKITDFRV